MPKHIGLYLRDAHAQPQLKTKNILQLIYAQARLNIPILSIYSLPQGINPAHLPSRIDDLIDLVKTLTQWKLIHTARIRVTIIGHWYDLPSRLVEPLKKLQEATRHHDTFFLNLCVHYDGQAEIVDAASIIARQVKLGRLDPEQITKETIKEALSTSYFVPPQLIITSGPHLSLHGFLLWDSATSSIFFTKKGIIDFSPQDMLLALEYYQSTRQEQLPQSKPSSNSMLIPTREKHS